MRDWTEIGFSSIYAGLAKLRKKGWVTAQVQSAEGKGPDRKVFTITDAGRSELTQAALNALRSPTRAYRNLELGLANLPGLPLEAAIEMLEGYRRDLSEKYRQVKLRAGDTAGSPDHVQILFDLSLSAMQAELDWLERTLHRLQRN